MSWRAILGTLVRTIATGADPAPRLVPARLIRARQFLFLMVIFLVALSAATSMERAGGAGQLVGVLSVAPLALLVHRPMLAWRVAWLVAWLSAVVPAPNEQSWAHPFTPAQLVVWLAVLFVVAMSQPQGVLIWVWLFTIGLALALVPAGHLVGAAVVVTAMLLAGHQVQRRSRHREPPAAPLPTT